MPDSPDELPEETREFLRQFNQIEAEVLDLLSQLPQPRTKDSDPFQIESAPEFQDFPDEWAAEPAIWAGEEAPDSTPGTDDHVARVLAALAPLEARLRAIRNLLEQFKLEAEYRALKASMEVYARLKEKKDTHPELQEAYEACRLALLECESEQSDEDES